MSHSTSLAYREAKRAFVVASTDPAVPEATVSGSREAGRYATCPACLTVIRLEETDGNVHTGLEYQLHYVHEHILPEERYQEAST